MLNTSDSSTDESWVLVHPIDELKTLANKWSIDLASASFATEMDTRNIYPCNRDKFCYPKLKDLPASRVDLSLVDNPEGECIYMCGNSLGLQPKTAKTNVDAEFDKWAKIGVFGHFEGDLPWATCEELLRPQMGRIVGAKTDEVNVMNFLTVNLHLMMISFYQPTEKRFKILLEDKAFPSDHVNHSYSLFYENKRLKFCKNML
jgi:kynureninase